MTTTIAWDVDDVLNDLLRGWFERSFRVAHPASPITYDQLSENPPHRQLGLEPGEFLASLDAFRLAHAAELSPTPEVLAWFERHGDEHRHVALTATPLHTAPISAAWVMRHFGRWIRTFAVIPSPRPWDTSKRWDETKGDWLSWCGKVDVLVDDIPRNLASAEAAGVRAVRWPRPWNGGGETERALAQLLDRPARDDDASPPR